MKIVGIICEYNPLHNGHVKQFGIIRDLLGRDTRIVCLMSGNYVQRGAPAIFDKSLRAQAAVMCGADLVLELPVTYALSSAEGFAAGGVRILGGFCDYLCFGSETGSTDTLLNTASALLSPAFPPMLHVGLDEGLSFPAARSAALKAMGLDGDILLRPNDILAVEYCKAILSQGCTMHPLPITRQGDYHALEPDAENPSATSIRERLLDQKSWTEFMPDNAAEVFSKASTHCTKAAERAILARLRTMTDAEFESLPYGSEGLWRKLMRESRRCGTLDEIIAAVKSKRYTRTRIDRMILCAFLGISKDFMDAPAPYARVLAFNDPGRALLKEAKEHVMLLNAGEKANHPYWGLEKRCGDLYGLCCIDRMEQSGIEETRRVYYHKENK